VLLGAHCSGGIKRGLDRAIEIGANALQIFAQSPRAWRFPDHDPADLERFRERQAESDVGSVTIHALYLVNLATPDDTVYDKSVETLRKTVDTACAIGADGVVVHVGSHLGAGFDAGLERALPALEQILERCDETTWLLLENSAGAGGTMGRSIEELATLYQRLEGHPSLGVCLDSCHLFVSGYDVRDAKVLDGVLDELDDAVGLDRLRALHVNDANAPLGSNRDRHANVGEGLIGNKLGTFLGNKRLQGLPAVLEVPGKDGHGPDADEVRKLKRLHARNAPKQRARARKK
jgi:deoxyribonuclease-4